MAEPRSGWRTFWQSDLVKAVAATLAVLAIGAAGALRQLAGNADNDSTLRLVEVRDLIAGQGWFDLHQYRMGLDGGLLMHWSRLVDAPIAAIILVVRAITGSQAAGETAALIFWPLILFGIALYLLLRIARSIGGEEAVFPALVLSTATLYYGGAFGAGSLDHHNIQLVLMLATVSLLLRTGDERRSAGLAGLCCVLMLAIGMETVPYVAAAGLAVGGWFLVKGEAAAGVAAAFGAVFAAASAVVFVATVPSMQWWVAYCDAYSVAQFSLGVVAGAGLWAVASIPALRTSLARRATALALLGVTVGGVAAVWFPQCLGDPYAGLPLMLRSYWLDAVDEAQPLWRLLASEPEAVAGHYATVLIGLAVLGLRIRKVGLRQQEVLFAVMLGAALLVSIWQVRGSRFSLPLACVPLAIWVAQWRRRAATEPATVTSLKMAGAWIASFNVTWILVAIGVWHLFAPAEAKQVLVAEECYKRADYATLAAMPAGRVLVISNLGASVLSNTAHSVLAGPYHRNVAGNLAALTAFMGSPDESATVVRDNGIGLVAFCPANNETKFLASRAPNGLLAGMVAGKIPGWLAIVPESNGKPLAVYRVIFTP
ncbi:MAG: GtrA family protein [Hyphomicrobiales bacterium]|nr:GtrA family protein [Hyphomicrobiales bacterium]